MKELEELIMALQKGIARKASYINTIKDPYLLVEALKELNDLIGNNKIKESVASQVRYMIMNKRRSMNDTKVKEEDVMLNTVLYGEPGVGKTLIGTKLAKIWYALGYLKGSKTKKVKRSVANNFTDNLVTNSAEDMNIMVIVIILIIILWMVALTWRFYTNYGTTFTLILIITILLLFVCVGYYMTNNKEEKINTKEIDNTYVNSPNIPTSITKNEDIINVVSRADFVGGYVGHTAEKTNKLLNENLGKVLFVDECYSLLQSSDDSFGMECLTTLNLYMSNHPNEIIIIFAGYKDLLEAGPFAAQPGLKRRFMWQFECEGYNSEELYDIFKFKLDSKGWKLDDPVATKKLFEIHQEDFPNFGGDVERLVFFTSLEHSRDFIKNDNAVNIDVFKVDHIRKGISKLVENSIKSNPGDSENPFANVMNLFRSNKTNKSNKSNRSNKSKNNYDDTPIIEDVTKTPVDFRAKAA